MLDTEAVAASRRFPSNIWPRWMLRVREDSRLSLQQPSLHLCLPYEAFFSFARRSSSISFVFSDGFRMIWIPSIISRESFELMRYTPFSYHNTVYDGQAVSDTSSESMLHSFMRHCIQPDHLQPTSSLTSQTRLLPTAFQPKPKPVEH